MIRVVTAAAAVGLLALSGCSSAPDPTIPPSATAAPAPAADIKPLPDGKPFDVSVDTLGIHAFQGSPGTLSTAFRMNCYPSWRDVETSKGEYNWQVFDDAVANQQAWGAQSLLYVFCGTPEWAAGKASEPESEVLGPGSAAPPKKLSDFEDYARAVVKRYKGTIGAYETWNEASTPQFWQGTPEQMTQMTEILHRVVKEEDPDALATMASVQTHRQDYYQGFAEPYLKQLKRAGWPFEVYNGHFYPEGKGGPAARRKQIAMFQKSLADLDAPKKPLWDTEVNYYTGLPGGEPDGRITGDRAAAWAVRTYLDGWRLDVPRNYWYFATLEYSEFPGIQTRPGDPATQALAKFGLWVANTRFNGCDQKGELVNCSFIKDGREQFIAWADSDKDVAESPRVVYPLDGPAQACVLTADTCETTSVLTVDEVPVLITPTA